MSETVAMLNGPPDEIKPFTEAFGELKTRLQPGQLVRLTWTPETGDEPASIAVILLFPVVKDKPFPVEIAPAGLNLHPTRGFAALVEELKLEIEFPFSDFDTERLDPLGWAISVLGELQVRAGCVMATGMDIPPPQGNTLMSQGDGATFDENPDATWDQGE